MEDDFYDAGQSQAFREVLIAILKAHPRPSQAGRIVHNVLEREIVLALNERLVPDRFVDGIQDALSMIEQILRDICDEP